VKLHIRPWHGAVPELVAKIETLTTVKVEDELNCTPVWQVEMSLDEFAAKWNNKFIVWPTETPNTYLVHVTHRGGFGQC